MQHCRVQSLAELAEVKTSQIKKRTESPKLAYMLSSIQHCSHMKPLQSAYAIPEQGLIQQQCCSLVIAIAWPCMFTTLGS